MYCVEKSSNKKVLLNKLNENYTTENFWLKSQTFRIFDSLAFLRRTLFTRTIKITDYRHTHFPREIEFPDYRHPI